jgi:copper resistance protein B
MKRLLIFLLAAAANPVLAQHEGHEAEETAQPATDPHSGHDVSAEPREHQENADSHASYDMGTMQDAAEQQAEASPPPAAFSGPAHVADTLFDQFQALYSRAIAPFFDVQVGVRHDVRPEPNRSHLVVGLQGLLPYVFGRRSWE